MNESTFRSHFTRAGKVVWGADLVAKNMDDARSEAIAILIERDDLNLDGIEIWCGTQCLGQLTPRIR
jgi:hypothetical protein